MLRISSVWKLLPRPYKEFLQVFVIMGEYHFAKEKDKKLFKN